MALSSRGPGPKLRRPPPKVSGHPHMSTSSVVRLGEYRDRREQRLREAVALHSADPHRSALVEELASALLLLSADRAAVVWVDEYGPGLVHVHTVLDVASDVPRRRFFLGPLKAAWDEGIPGLLDSPESDGELSVYSERPRSQAVVSLGSDGVRAWFMVVDSKTPRTRLSREASEFLMFFAGGCAAVILHDDLPDPAEGPHLESERLREERFAGWPVLRDMEGREGDEEADRRISVRFMVCRVLRHMIDDDFAVDPEVLEQQVEGVRREVGSAGLADDSEARHWDRVLDAARDGDLSGLASAVLELANDVENQGHLHGARELHRCAYDVAVAAGSGAMVVDALRFHARTCRKMGELEVADCWYGKADQVARELGDRPLLGQVLMGRVNLKRQLGNLPAARALVAEQEEFAERSGLRDLLARCHHARMGIEIEAGEWDEAVIRGWKAFGLYEADLDRLIALSDLGWALVACGSLRSAEDAFAVVIERAPHALASVNALEGMARLAALEGDRAAFERWRDRSDEALRGAGSAFSPELKRDRAESFVELGMTKDAREWLQAALDEARTLSRHRVYFDAERRLEELGKGDLGEVPGSDIPEEFLKDSGDGRVTEVLQELSELRSARGAPC